MRVTVTVGCSHLPAVHPSRPPLAIPGRKYPEIAPGPSRGDALGTIPLLHCWSMVCSSSPHSTPASKPSPEPPPAPRSCLALSWISPELIRAANPAATAPTAPTGSHHYNAPGGLLGYLCLKASRDICSPAAVCDSQTRCSTCPMRWRLWGMSETATVKQASRNGRAGTSNRATPPGSWHSKHLRRVHGECVLAGYEQEALHGHPQQTHHTRGSD